MKQKEINTPVIVKFEDLTALDEQRYCETCSLPISSDGTVKDCPYSCDRVISSDDDDDYKELDFATGVVTQYDLEDSMYKAIEDGLYEDE
jgi:hypothetical protein